MTNWLRRGKVRDEALRDESGAEPSLSRRSLLQGAAFGASGAFAATLGARVWAEDSHQAPAAPPVANLRKINLAWTPVGVCLSPVALAQQRDIFTKHGLSVEFVSFGSSTEMLLEALATGKADAGVGMALRWLKPLEQGFDVKIVAGTHGGCMRLLAGKSSGITSLESLKGKVVAVSDLGSPAKNFFAILLAKRGLDPNKDVDWRVYPGDLLATAVEKNEAQAIAHWDPDTFRFLKGGNLVEIATNLTGEYADRACCVVGIGNRLIKEDRATAGALTKALLEAQTVATHHPEQVADVYANYAPKYPKDDVVAMLKSQTHNHSPVGAAIKREIALYTEDLKLVQVMKPGTDPVKFAERVYADVLS